MATTEQWLAEGNCEICRRNKYCKKLCTATKRNAQRELAVRTAVAMQTAMIKFAPKEYEE